ncbi:recombinase family protein [Micromonospora sp. CPCC 206061]|uniref:recombinase family protein n=1 Tax=Micromonospora sp. CPCC 206061 TaxID=3122410 RepID=UPI002FEEE89B
MRPGPRPQPAPHHHRLVQDRRPRHPHQPRYTGRQVWNKQRKDEVLIDVEDVALGHETKVRWNNPETWIWSSQVVHEPLVSDDDYRKVHAQDEDHDEELLARVTIGGVLGRWPLNLQVGPRR